MKRLILLCLVLSVLVGAIGITAFAVGVSEDSEAPKGYGEVFGGTGIDAIAEGVTLIKTGLIGKKMVFTDGDFKSVFAIDDFDKITVTSLPSSTEGVLLLAGRRVREGQDIKRRNIAAMVFVPESDEVTETSFGFTLDGGAECRCELRFIDRINYSPKIEEANMTSGYVTTQREIGVYGKIKATDPEGDELDYMVVVYPKFGSVTLSEDGRYRYTPKDGFTGYDSFVAVVRDVWGNWSLPTRVNLKVVERMSEIVYSDLAGKGEYNAAVAMTALGIMSGRQLGDSYYFDSEAGVTREEFVAMALKAYGISPGTASTFFDDDDAISEAVKGYVAEAVSRGIVDGELTDGALVFAPTRIITLYEAADVISRMLGVKDTEGGEYIEAEGVPHYKRGSLAAMITLGIIDEEDDPLAELTRGAAAELLYKMVNNC